MKDYGDDKIFSRSRKKAYYEDDENCPFDPRGPDGEHPDDYEPWEEEDRELDFEPLSNKGNKGSSDNNSNDDSYDLDTKDNQNNTEISNNDGNDDIVTINDQSNDKDTLQISNDHDAESSELTSEEYYVNVKGTISLVKSSEESESHIITEDKEVENSKEPFVVSEDLELITDPDELEKYSYQENINEDKEEENSKEQFVISEDLELITDPDELEKYSYQENINNADYKELDNDTREVNGDELELITDPDELENYSYQENIYEEEYKELDYDTREVNGDELELITDPDELENYDHYEEFNVEDFTEDNELEAAYEEYEEYDYDTEEINGDDFELIPNPDELENLNHYENNNTDLSRDNDQEEYELLEKFDQLNEQTYKEQIQEQITEADQTENEKLPEEIFATENDKEHEIKLIEIVEDIINRAQIQQNEISSEDRDIINSEDDTLYSGNKRNSSYQSSISRLSSEPFTFQISTEQVETYDQEGPQEQDNQDEENKNDSDNEANQKKEENKKQDQDTTNKSSNGKSSKSEKKNTEKNATLPELYRKETNRRPFYAGKKTEGFKKWLQQREQEQTRKTTNHPNEVYEEWEKLLKKWINEADEEDISKELKEKLSEVIKKYNKLKRIFPQITILLKKENITQSEVEKLLNHTIQVDQISPVERELFENLYHFAKFYDKNEIWYQEHIEEQREKFINHLAQKLEKFNRGNDSHERKEEWADVLLNHIQTILDKEISQDTKDELINVIKNYDKLEKTLNVLPPNLKQIIEELEQFKANYNVYKERGYEEGLPLLKPKASARYQTLSIPKFLHEEIEFLKEQGLNIKPKVNKKWFWLKSNRMINDYFISVLLPYYLINPEITLTNLKALGFGAFLGRVKRIKKEKVRDGRDFSQIRDSILINNKEHLFRQMIDKFGLKKFNEKLEYAKQRLKLLEETVAESTLRQQRNKIQLFYELGYTPIRCEECDTGFENLISLQLHHPTDKKTITLNDYLNLSKSNQREILGKFRDDKVRLLCRNHHIEKSAFYPIIFNNLIFDRQLFLLSPEKIDVYIKKYLENFMHTKEYQDIIKEKYISKGKKIPEKIKIKWKFSIKIWLKKEFVFKELFNHQCVNCGDTNLLHLDLHHSDSNIEKKFETWTSIAHLDCEEIMHLIIENKCVCLCGNCHILITYKYHLSVKEIVKRFFPQYESEIIASKVKKNHEEIMENISNFRFNLNTIDFKSPLKLAFGVGDAWKKMLVYMYLLSLKKGVDIISTKELKKILSYKSLIPINVLIQTLHPQGFVEIIKKSHRVKGKKNYILTTLRLTEKGINLSKKFLEEHPNYVINNIPKYYNGNKVN